ncbi:unnamed protein product, partial [Polarella glacialis]
GRLSVPGRLRPVMSAAGRLNTLGDGSDFGDSEFEFLEVQQPAAVQADDQPVHVNLSHLRCKSSNSLRSMASNNSLCSLATLQEDFVPTYVVQVTDTMSSYADSMSASPQDGQGVQ